jgi:hypothetical protein
MAHKEQKEGKQWFVQRPLDISTGPEQLLSAKDGGLGAGKGEKLYFSVLLL